MFTREINRTTLLVVWLLLVIEPASSSDAVAQSREIFGSVPQEQRPRLQARLAEFVLAHRSKDWSKVFDFLGDQYLDAHRDKYGKQEFIDRKLYSRIKRFTPASVQKMDDQWWMIWGCASFDRGGNLEGSLEAYLVNGEWYFSEIWSVSEAIDRAPKSCKHN